MGKVCKEELQQIVWKGIVFLYSSVLIIILAFHNDSAITFLYEFEIIVCGVNCTTV